MMVAVFAATILWLFNIEIREGDRWGAGIFMSNYASQSMAFIAAMILCIFLWDETNSRPKKYLFSFAIILFIFNVFFVSTGRSGYFALPFVIVFAVGPL